MAASRRRTLLVVGSFCLVAAVTLAAGYATATAAVAHVEAATLVDGEVEGVEPAAEPDRLSVRIAVENPTRTDFRFRTAFLQVFHDGAVVASNTGISFDRTTVPAGQRRVLVVAVAIGGDDPEAVREAAREGELTAAGRLEGRIVDRSFRVSIEDPDRE